MSRLLGFLDALALSCQRSGSEGLWDCTPGEVLGSMQVQTVGGSSAGNLRPVVVSDVAHLPRSFSSAGISPLRSPTPVMLVGEEKGHEGDPDEVAAKDAADDAGGVESTPRDRADSWGCKSGAPALWGRCEWTESTKDKVGSMFIASLVWGVAASLQDSDRNSFDAFCLVRTSPTVCCSSC